MTALGIRAQLPNAWQITDNSTAAGSAINYATNLPPALRVAATNLAGGFRFSINARFVTNFSGTKAMAIAYGTGARRFLIWFELDSNGDLTAELEGSPPVAVTASGRGTLLYHTHEIVYSPSSATATYLFDGQSMVTNWPGSSSALPAGQVFWGSGSSAGMGQMNFHSISFQVTNTTVANYNAGISGNPTIAQDPVTAGWAISIDDPAPGASVTNISPDVSLLAAATTLAADRFAPTSARLNGTANPRGSPTMAWFEWGTDTNYGNTTPMQSVGSSVGNVSVRAVVDGLAIGPDYHFRLVASNAFGLVTGLDQVFDLNFSPPAATTLPAEANLLGGFTLNGSVNPNGLPTMAWFEWGTTTTYGNVTPITDMGQENLNSNLTRVLTSIPNGGDYHFRVVASNAFGVVAGNDVLFNVLFLPRFAGVIPDLSFSSVASADYDRDGDLDVLGDGFSQDEYSHPLHRNNFNANWPVWDNEVRYTRTNTFRDSSLAWADYNNDGRLDFLVTGQLQSGSRNSQLWENTGGVWVDVPVSGLPGVSHGSVAWGDYDNDGRPDFFLTGLWATGPGTGVGISQLWRNTGTGFTYVPIAGLPGVSESSVAWADYDNDGRLDFLITGRMDGTSTGISQLWRNIGNGFAHVPVAGLPDVYNSSVAWADYDNDGRLDFLITGRSALAGSSAVSQLWRNTGNGFAQVPIAGLAGVFGGSAAWADYDNDGRPDFLLTGRTSQIGLSQVWRNTGSGFAHVPVSALPGVSFSSISWADYNNDGRVDFLLTGTTNFNESGTFSRFFRNYALVTNNAPLAPGGLSSSFSNGWTHLRWSPATDAQTPSAGLSYNLRVGSTPSGEDVVSPMALPNGFRLLPELGNAQMRTYSILNLAPGTYYWSVQAIDTAFAGGPFAPEASFVVPGPRLSIVLSNSNAHISWQPSATGWILQQSASLHPAEWTNAASGETNPIVVPATDETGFYRLISF